MRLSLLALLALPALAQEFRPFEVQWRPGAGVMADMSFLLDVPAGKDGFIRAERGHLYTGAGKRFRIWGVNLSFTGSLPRKEDAPDYAAHLARFGINCVRIHHLDWRTPRGIIDSRYPDSRHLDPDVHDRFDFFVNELKKRGIYVNLNLNVARAFQPADGVKDAADLGFAKAVTYFDPRIVELEQEYAHAMLAHKNPYTGLEYRNDPVVAMVEILNENSLIESWVNGRLTGKGPNPGNPDRTWTDIPASYANDLTMRYQEWLAPRVTAADREAILREAGSPPARLKPAEFAQASPLRFRTEAAFYMELESSFFEKMASYLKNTLKIHQPIVGTSAHSRSLSPYPLLSSTSRLDIVDAHTYWQHPRYYMRDGKRLWDIPNTPMVNSPENSTVMTLGRVAVKDKPFIVSEVNHPYPNEYAAEGMLIAAAYGAFHDWDGVFWYSFSHTEPSAWKPGPPSFFDIWQDPVRMAQTAAAALLFERRDVAPARKTIGRGYSRNEVPDSLRMTSKDAPLFTPGFPPLAALAHGTRVAAFDRACSYQPFAPSGKVTSDTGELTWTLEPADRKVVIVDTPRSQALIGFVKAAQPAARNLIASIETDFCALSLQSMEPVAIERASRLLLVAAARTANQGMTWNEKRTATLTEGTAPVTIEPVRGTVTLRNLAAAASVHLQPMDGGGKPLGSPIAAEMTPRGWQAPIGQPATVWYMVLVSRRPPGSGN